MVETLAALSAGFTSGIIDVLRSNFEERLSEAKAEYAQRPKDITSPLEQLRSEKIENLAALRTEASLRVSDGPVLQRILASLHEQMISAYEAGTIQELNSIHSSIKTIDSVIDQAKKMQNKRAIARLLASVLSIGALVGLGVLIFWSSQVDGLDANTVLPLIQIPVPVLIWSSIGSLTAVLYRFNSSSNIELQDPLRWLFTRPLTGIVMGSFAYLIFKIGLLSIATEGIDTTAIASSEILWVVAFIVGFSDRLADSILRTLVGRFGGDAKSDLVTIDNAAPDFSSLLTFLENPLGREKKSEDLEASKSTPTLDNLDRAKAQENGKTTMEPQNLATADTSEQFEDLKKSVAEFFSKQGLIDKESLRVSRDSLDTNSSREDPDNSRSTTEPEMMATVDTSERFADLKKSVTNFLINRGLVDKVSLQSIDESSDNDSPQDDHTNDHFRHDKQD
jgi:hypothetical protein